MFDMNQLVMSDANEQDYNIEFGNSEHHILGRSRVQIRMILEINTIFRRS